MKKNIKNEEIIVKKQNVIITIKKYTYIYIHRQIEGKI